MFYPLFRILQLHHVCLSISCFWLMNGPHPAPSSYSATASVGSSLEPPEKAVIRIHFFPLCALVHCLSSSVQCNQVNEQACNEAIRCSLVLQAQHSILSSQTLAPSVGAVVRGEWTQSAQRN